jgi:hypothetical protein
MIILAAEYSQCKTISTGKIIKSMHQSMDIYKELTFLQPDILPMKVGISQLFTIPVNDAVGTTQMANGVSLIHINNDKKEARIECLRRKISRDLFDQQGFYVSPFSESIIAFGQSRTMMFFNLKTLSYMEKWVVPSLNEDLKRVFPVPGSVNKFIFEMDTPFFDIANRELLLYEFGKDDLEIINQPNQGIGLDDKNNKKTLQVLKKVTLGNSDHWFVVPNKNNFLVFNSPSDSIDPMGIRHFPFGKCEIKCYNESLNLTIHPLIESYNQIRMSISGFINCSIHPTLPIGFIGAVYDSRIQEAPGENSDIYSTLYLIRWNHPDEKKRAIPLFNHLVSIYPYLKPKSIYTANESINPNTFRFCEFSQDGSWMVFADATESNDNPMFYAFPVDEKYPLFIGKPVILGKAFREDGIMQSTACCFMYGTSRKRRGRAGRSRS